MKKATLLAILTMALSTVWGQNLLTQTDFWSDGVKSSRQQRRTLPDTYRAFTMDVEAVRNFASTKAQARGGSASFALELPLPDGKQNIYQLKEASIMAPGLAARYPQIRTYKGRSADGASSIRVSITPKGFHAQIFTPEGIVYIDPNHHLNAEYYYAYYRKDYQPINDPNKVFIEESEPLLDALKTDVRRDRQESHDHDEELERTLEGSIYKYRIAIAASFEYSNFHGGTVEGALAAIVTTLNRNAGIYEKELSISFELIDDNDKIIYITSDDPYSNNNPSAALSENQENLDNVIGTENYDIGHIFTTGSGGLASVNSVCSSTSKARGTTGTSSPVGDSFDVDFVAHEIGHQFGAYHTFNGDDGSCSGGNRTGATAMEPGSGTTIMAYAGICSSQNIQNNSDAYFHVISIQQILEFSRDGTGEGCAEIISNDNTAPVVTIPEGGWVIPAGTPFTLMGTAEDAEGDDMTYCWEQTDIGPAGDPNSPVGDAPLFRSFSPTSDNFRSFPRVSDVITGNQTFGEIMASYSRNMTFRLTVRDGNGGLTYEELEFEVDDSNGEPFTVDNPASSIAGGFLEVSWDVASTDLPPYNVSDVNIYLSTDGGNSFEHVLAEGTANDGVEFVVLPTEINSGTCRIKVEANDNIFYNVNTNNFVVSSSGEPDYAVAIDPLPGVVCSPDDMVFTIITKGINGFDEDLNLSVNGLADELISTFSESTISAGDTVTLSISGTSNAVAVSNSFNFVVSPTSAEATTIPVDFDIKQALTIDPVILSPLDNETSVPTNTQFFWNSVSEDALYSIDIATDEDFENIVFAKVSLDDTVYQPEELLEVATTYYWRVKAVNDCNETDYTTASFVTVNLECTIYEADDVPQTIGASATELIQSSITLTEDAIINDINLVDLDITHSWINDLVLFLTGPDDEVVNLLTRPCSGESNMFLSFDHEGIDNASLPCPPIDGGAYQPEGDLSGYYGTSMQGTWTLTVQDNVSLDGGSVNGWGLEVCVLNTGLELSGEAISASQNDLSWFAESIDGITGYELQVSEDDGVIYTRIAELDASTTTFSHTGLNYATTYKYRVRAVTTNGPTEYSNVLSLTTLQVPPAAPTNLLVTNFVGYTAQLSWTDNSDNEDGFIIEIADAGSSDFSVADSTGRQFNFISAYASFMKQTPCPFSLQATEPTEVAVIGLEASGKLLNYSPRFEKLARIAMEEEMISHQEIIASLLTLRPEERYAELLQNNPEIFQRVSQIQIASFIGVQPESLSRIKKRHQQQS